MTQEQRSQPLTTFAATAVAALFLATAAQAQQGNAPRPRAAAPAPVPTATAAHAAADAGYKAYARRDFAAAMENAQKAVQLAPTRRDYWLLLAQSQLALGQLPAAQQSLDRAAQASGDDAPLARARTDLARARAQVAGTAMYAALAANDLTTAIAQGRVAVEAAPEHAGYRLVLVNALLRTGQFADAERIAGETVALLPDSAVPLALRGYARHALGRAGDAAADLDRAVQQRNQNPATQRQLRLLAADLALARGDRSKALDYLQPLPASDADATARRGYAQATGIAMPALVPPTIDCSAVDTSQTCGIQVAALPASPGHLAATAAYRAMEQKDYGLALAQARRAAAASPGQRDWQLLLLEAAVAANQPEEAERAATAALALRADGAVLARRSTLRRAMGNVAGANEDAEAALQAGNLPPQTELALLADLGRGSETRARLRDLGARPDVTPAMRLDLAYLASRVGDNRSARENFNQADAAGALPPTSLLDAGYAAMKSRQDDEAVAYFKRAIDANNALQLKMEPQMLYDTRRTVSEVARRWGVLASLTVRNAGGVAPTFGAVGGGGPSGQRVTQVGAEAYWRPWGYRNGQFVELFARGFETLHSEAGGLEGGDSFQGALGVRWKPLSGQNAVLSLSRVFGPNVTSEWLGQAAWSYDAGGDLRVDVPSWWTTRIAAEVGRYFSTERNYGLASLMFGRSYLVGGSGRTVVYPHGVIAYEYSSADNPKSGAGIGPGVSVRHWFREDAYHAPQSYFDLTLQYRARISGDDRLQGLYFNTLLSY
jgi:adsorption protein A